MKNLTYLILGLVLVFTACEPALEEKIDIGNPPTGVNFEYTFDDLNTVSFTNTSTNDGEPFLINWDLGDFGIYTTDNIDSVSFATAGSYDVSLTILGQGGSATKTETIVITQDIPSACNPILEFLTNCTSKVWKLNADAGALWVGPDVSFGTTWWENAAADVATRDCDWNDEFTFHAVGNTLVGTYDYVSQGDFWGEAYTGVSPDGCEQITNLPANYAEWGDGTHDFEIIESSGFAGLGQLKVKGLGAYLGLRKPYNGAEMAAGDLLPTDITYDIVSMTNDGDKDILEILVDAGGVIWRYRLASE
jgi:PKD repeat protein